MAEELEIGGESIASLDKETWKIVVQNRARYELLRRARLGDIEQIASFLLKLDSRIVRYNWYFDLVEYEE